MNSFILCVGGHYDGRQYPHSHQDGGEDSGEWAQPVHDSSPPLARELMKFCKLTVLNNRFPRSFPLSRRDEVRIFPSSANR